MNALLAVSLSASSVVALQDHTTHTHRKTAHMCVDEKGKDKKLRGRSCAGKTARG